MSFDAGAIVFAIRAAGMQVFENDLARGDRAVDKFGKTSSRAASQTEELGKKQDKTTEQTRKHQKAQEEAARKADEYGKAQEKVGTVLVGAGAAIVATTALTVRSAIQWESAWAGVTKTVDGTAEELAEVEGGLRGLTGILPASHTEIAAVAEAAGQLGVQTDNVVAFTRTMIDLGETTNLSATEAATSLARFMNVMGTSQDQVSNLGSAVVELGNNYATTEAEIVEMATRLSGAARQVGLTEGETLGLATALSSVGIEAEAGGSAVSKVMVDIAASVDAGGDRVEQFAKVAGLSAEEFSQKWKTDPGAALAGFVKGLADAEMQGESTLGILADLGITEVRTRDALLRAAAASDQFTAAMGVGNDAFAKNNALAEEAAKRYETVESQLGIMRNRINDAAIDLGSVFLPAISDAAAGVGDFAGFIAGLPAPLQEVISVGGLLTGTVAVLAGTALIAVPKIVAFRAAVQTLTNTSGRAERALSGLGGAAGKAGVAAAFVIAVTAAEALGDVLAEAVGPSAEEVASKVALAQSGVELFAAALQRRDASPAMVENAGEAFSLVGAAIDDAKAKQDNWFDGISGANQDVLSTVYSVGEELKSLAETDMSAATGQFRQFADDAGLTEDQIVQLMKEMPGFRDELIKAAKAAGVASDDQSLLNFYLQQTEPSAKSAASGYIEAADGAAQLRNDLDQLIDVLNEANGIGQDANAASIDYQNTLRDVDEQIRNVRDGVEGFGKGIDDTTQAGADNRQMLLGMAEDSQEVAQAVLNADGNTQNFVESLKEGRKRLIESATAMGATKDEATALADEIYRIPTDKEIKVLAETEDAMVKIQRLKDRLASVPGYRSVTLETITVGNKTVTAQAEGSVRTYANGGVEHHVAQIARAGEYRVWAEDETGGEAYIPLAASKRARSEQIMMQTAERLGGAYTPSYARRYADGGSTAASGGARDRAFAPAAPLIGSLTIQGSGNVRSDLDEITFHLRTLQRGGRVGR